MGTGSIWHWVIVLLVIVLLFGAKRIPELAKGLGSGVKNFKKAIKEDDEDQEKITQNTQAKPQSENIQSTESTSEQKH
ncbi:twin-arginine translocase TatA/TatE family subunit [Helicobacter equorum]|uniref:Sec-independent protein translocase protein TatA n=1 Tax=Helicobacter equorum TaxID=361872 RepID=A0A3D8ITN8_9HELI|nr:twin-arginine translocase TatA/TatE family subunit [Helicobacter equorum]MCI6312866.1 twin-arginine translocase TatA/TatE family subunit [Helicobacter sp.]MCI7711589.1 twin-arginine translocase TatA/TatE family subunit [Helicobacter sp.]MDD7346262.1 twin-arginine translocase TatA/TatE family subunit [Helicobacter sp.]MDY2822838.1 twin-arginine translocase TatA/TatE family subunit [Helicobacter sp.]RDU68582.1 twin-arginine translocase TatA/TatE family subunit [Helicobacter equorum]